MIEEVDQSGIPKSSIITKNKDGTILCEDKFEGKLGRNFSTVVDQSNDEGLFISKLKTINEKGEVLATHEIKMQFDEVLGEDYFEQDQSQVQTYQREGQTIKVTKTDPVVAKNTVLKSTIVEEVNDQGSR